MPGATPKIYTIDTDHLDTPRVIKNNAGTIVWRWDHAEPFGANPPNQNPGGLGTFTYNLRFPGQYYDQETGLHYNMERFYDPQTGRYFQSDPIGLNGGINTYAYVANNPLRWVDPKGLYTEIIVWQPVGWMSSSFGHVSSNVNGENYSWSPGGWDSTYSSASDYAARQQTFRSGIGVILNLTPEQEQKLVACYKKNRSGYDKFTNNCGQPQKNCLKEATGGALSDSFFPASIGNDLLDSSYYGGSTLYDGPSTPRGFLDNAPWAR
jgi:RHS repeat-associated protein